MVTRSLRCAGLARACANWPRIVAAHRSARLVAVLHELGYSLQANAKTLEALHPDRNAQFEHIHRKVRRFLSQVNRSSRRYKKKELWGPSKTEGESYGSRGTRSRCGP